MKFLILSTKKIRAIAIFLLQIMLLEILTPLSAVALTGGPSQPEVESFEPVGTTEMVDPFTGDFVYNIPLLDVEGMPVNISYHSGITMDQEASWVGLGWNINPGAITRQMRGLPDDFNGDRIVKEFNVKDNKTWGASISGKLEWFGKEKTRDKYVSDTALQMSRYVGIDTFIEPNHLKPNASLSLGVNYNNYTGLGYEVSLNAGLGIGVNKDNNKDLTLGLGANASSYSSFDLTPAIGYRKSNEKGKTEHSFGMGIRYNTLEGIKELTGHYSGPRGLSFRGMAPFGSVTYVPQLVNEYINHSGTYNLHFGPEASGLFWGAGAKFYHTRQELKNRSEAADAYGYLYSENMDHNSKGNFVMDFNRVNDGIYVKSREYMPFANYTYDIFNIAGEGTGGVFRPFRSDVGVLFDADRENHTRGLGVGLGYGGGNIFKADIDVNGTFGKSRSGRWYKNKGRDDDFTVIDHLGFRRSNQYNRRYEPAYFKVSGEKNKNDEHYFEDLGGRYPMRLGLEYVQARSRSELQPHYFTKEGKDNIDGAVIRERDPRTTLVSYLNDEESGIHALDRKIRSFPHNSFSMDATTNALEWTSEEERRSGKHLSEFTVTNSDGRRYVYGIPAQNTLQREATFNVVDPANPGSLSKDESKGSVVYNGGVDNTTSNGKGVDGFFSRNTLPAYAHSFLLTAILSTDYVDVTGDGISDDDIGTAVKLNYTKAYEEYKWRTPFSRAGNEAFYQEGYKNDQYDDKGSYIYGSKEVWYLHSIESKNYVACFYTSKRQDACGVLGEDGGIDTASSFHKLDSIQLYTKNDLLLSGSQKKPIKTVFFEYDYTLCTGIPNHKLNSGGVTSNGKLTLRKIYFTYGKSRKGKLSPYQFTYSDVNPVYTAKGYDRWGHYKPMPSNSDIEDIANSATGLATHDDPYVTREQEDADDNMQAWSLTSIKLPSGGKIDVEYESDDYAFVQDREAMEMFPVLGASHSSQYSTNSTLYDVNYKPGNLGRVKDYLFFALPNSLSASQLDAAKKKYFPSSGEKVFFKFLLNLKQKENHDPDKLKYEFVSGHVKMGGYGFSESSPGSGVYDIGWVRLTQMTTSADSDYGNSNKEVMNPISKTAHTFMKAYQPMKVHALFSNFEPAPGESNIWKTFNTLGASFAEARLMFRSFYKEMEHKEVAKNFVPNKSFIRLKCPSGKKLGGGSRVKKITINDNWSQMVSGGQSASYGQEFFYDKLDERDSTRSISSGVASNEPNIGKEESPFTQLYNFREKNIAAPDNRFTLEGPLLNEFFPAPVVGYSRVRIQNIKPASNIKRTATGYTVKEFYTAKDFPVISDNTDKKALPNFGNGEDQSPAVRKAIKAISRLLKYPVIEREFVTQGYSIELNDMHAKPKAEWSYAEGNPNYISGVEYKYKTHKYNGINVPSDTVSVINSSGEINSRYIGKEFDMNVDLRWAKSQTLHGALQNNLEGFFAGFFAMVFRAIPQLSYQETEFGSAVSTKVIYRYGIMDEIVVHDQSASVSTKNILFDAESGQVILTRTTNEFNDPIYSFNYPAYYAYYGMGPGYLNTGITLTHMTFLDGVMTGLPTYKEFIKEGDELILSRVITVNGLDVAEDPYTARLWAVADPNTPNELVFMSRSGHLVHLPSAANGYFKVKIIRSGNRNMQSVSMGAATSLQNPISDNGNGNHLDFEKVLNSAAVEFSDYWASPYRSITKEVLAKLPPSPTVEVGGGNPYTASCSLDCYLKLIDTLTNPLTAPKNLITLAAGDYIDLTKEPYAALYNCIKNSTSAPCAMFAQSGGILTYGSTLISDIREAKPWLRNPLDDNAVCYNDADEENPGGYSEMTMRAFVTDDCDPFDENNCNLVKSYIAGACTLFVCTKLITPCIQDATPSEGINCELGYTTKRSVPSYTEPCEAHLVVKTRQSCGEMCSGCDTADLLPPDPPSDGPDALGNCNLTYRNPRINPYTQGIKGNFRASSSWVFYDKRSQGTNFTDIRTEGIYLNYSDFWDAPNTSGYFTKSTSLSNWRKTNDVTLINRTGNEIENKDPLNIYSAALFGYNQSIAKAVGSNMKYRQLVFDGFEDYDYPLDDYENHFSYRGYSLSDTAHSGKKSLRVPANSSAVANRPIRYLELLANPTQAGTDNHYYKKPLEDMPLFSPDAGTYLLGCWIKEPVTCPTGYTGDTVIVKITKFSIGHPLSTDTVFRDTLFKLVARGPVIEGWQRIDSGFTVPDSVKCISVILKAGSNGCNFDDLRIFPSKGNVKSFVYDPKTLRLMAQLDENNYATFYEYDPEGRLIRVKRETERGIMTIQESRTGLKKTSNAP